MLDKPYRIMVLKDCIDIYRAFDKLSALSLPLKSSWMIAQNMSKLRPIVESFDTTRDMYATKLREEAPKNADGEIEVNEEMVKAFQAQVAELLEEPQKIRLKKVTLYDTGNLQVEPAALVAAMDYLILEEDANPVR